MVIAICSFKQFNLTLAGGLFNANSDVTTASIGVGMATATDTYFYQLDGPGILKRVVDTRFSTPAVPAGFIKIRAVASAISPGTELSAWRGDPPLRPTQNQYPRLVGYCFVGEIEGIGDRADQLPDGTPIKIGDRVLTQSAHRSRDLVEPAKVIAKLENGADAMLASTTYLFHLGYSACLRAGVLAGHSVAVVGLGTLGLTTAAVARMAGARTTGYSNHHAVSTAKTYGFDAVLPKTPDPTRARHDIVVTTSNRWDDWQLALSLAAKRGTVVMLGFPGRGQPLPDFNPLGSEYVYDRQLTIMSCGYTANLDAAAEDLRFTLKRNCSFLMDCISRTELPAASIIEKVVPAVELDKAYAFLEDGRSGSGTIVLDWLQA